MKTFAAFLVAAALTAAFPTLAQEQPADHARMSFGGDQYAAGQNTAIDAPVTRDAFIAGYDVALKSPVAGDAHMAGFSVDSTAAVTSDLYAAGFSVDVAGPVGADVTAIGNNVHLRDGATVGGNARLAGQSVTLAAPVAGSALVTAQTLTLEAAITGDLDFFGETLVFGPGARVDGKVMLQAPREIAVPASVAAADRVTFTRLVNPDYVSETRRTAENVVRSFWPAVWATLAWVVFLLLVGAAFIALLPRLVASLEVISERRPFRTFGVGILTFASTVGLLIVAVLTLVGLLAIPFVLIYIAIACSIAYLTGAYLIAVRIGSAFLRIDTNLRRLGALAAGLVLAILLAMVPVLGWLLTLVILCYGFGAFAMVTMIRWSARDAARLAAADTAPPLAGKPAE